MGNRLRDHNERDGGDRHQFYKLWKLFQDIPVFDQLAQYVCYHGYFKTASLPWKCFHTEIPFLGIEPKEIIIVMNIVVILKDIGESVQ